jgi:hypothetical protein
MVVSLDVFQLSMLLFFNYLSMTLLLLLLLLLFLFLLLLLLSLLLLVVAVEVVVMRSVLFFIKAYSEGYAIIRLLATCMVKELGMRQLSFVSSYI